MLLTRPEQRRIDLPLEAIARVCEKYGVSELGGGVVPNQSERQSESPGDSDIIILWPLREITWNT